MLNTFSGGSLLPGHTVDTLENRDKRKRNRQMDSCTVLYVEACTGATETAPPTLHTVYSLWYSPVLERNKSSVYEDKFTQAIVTNVWWYKIKEIYVIR